MNVLLGVGVMEGVGVWEGVGLGPVAVNVGV